MLLSIACILTFAAPVASSAVTSFADAAVHTCDGKPATIVGDRGAENLGGTSGNDVIVSYSERTDGGGGDDVICLVELPMDHFAYVTGGDGNDTIFAQDAGKYFGLRVDIRVGDDAFRGGAGRDHVRYSPAYDEDPVLVGNDVIDTGGGPDEVEIYRIVGDFTGSVDLSHGDDSLKAFGIRFGPDTALAGGDGHDELQISLFSDGSPINVAVNAKGDGVATVANQPSRSWSSFQRLAAGASGPLTYHGSQARDDISVSGTPTTQIFTRGGDDQIEAAAGTFGNSTYSVRAGRGNDTLKVRGREVVVDLNGGTFGRNSEVTSAENAIVHGPLARVAGSVGANRILIGCAGNALGRQGDDLLTVVKDCYEDARLTGGPGADTMIGARGDDYLAGGSGRDLAKGREGHDVCLAEQRLSCER